MCNNYNFKGRKLCFRCKKVKGEDDLDGKPQHLIKKQNKGKVVCNNSEYKIHLDNRAAKMVQKEKQVH